jgi:DNA-directed RNA polymerase subunit P
MSTEEYRCAKCNEPHNINSLGLQCEKCGYMIFLKDRPVDKKVYKSD